MEYILYNTHRKIFSFSSTSIHCLIKTLRKCGKFTGKFRAVVMHNLFCFGICMNMLPNYGPRKVAIGHDILVKHL